MTNWELVDMTEQNQTLTVRMLGGFSLSYQGEEIVLGRNTTAKFVQLLQLLWLRGDKGISKQQIVRCLYEDDELSNPNNSFNNLIFQMRKQMVAAGLPRKNYITKVGKTYIPDPTVSIKVDVQEVHDSVQRARESSDKEEKTAAYLAAFERYHGILLPESENKAWVVTESVQLRDEFAEAVRYLGNRAKEQNDFDEMYRIFEKAARIYPDNDWQADQIEALICKEDYKEAFRLYDRTVQHYSDEMGLPPSEKMLENYRKMSQKITSPMGQIQEIQSSLQEDPLTGAYYCSYPSFIDMYHVLERNMERTGYSVFLLLCTLVDYAGKPIANREKLDLRSETLKECIGCSLRRGDIYTRYSASQYLVLLVGSSREGCDVVSHRISAHLKEREGTKADVRYSNVSLADLSRMILSNETGGEGDHG